MSNNILKRLLSVILAGNHLSLLVSCLMSAVWKTEAVVNLLPPNPETFSFLCQDQMVKIDSEIYHLDRLRSSLKSNYFEKLFTSGDFQQKNDNVLEIKPKHGEVFPIVIDLIHGRKKLIDVLSKENYVSLLKAIDHLEMEIDLEIVSNFINDNLKSYSPKNAKIFKLYKFVRKNCKFEYLLKSVFQYFSNHLKSFSNHEVISSVPLNHLIRIIKSVENVDDEKRCEIVQTCTKWLCRDMKNRLPHMVILMNSIKPVFHSANESDNNNGTSVKCLPEPNVGEKAKQKIISRCVFALLSYGGELNPTIIGREDLFADECADVCDTDHESCEYELEAKRKEYDEYEEKDSPPSIVNSNNEYEKLRKFLKNGDFYDITVRVGEKAYQLHRVVLESWCGYFADIFRAEYAEAMVKRGGIPTCPCKNKAYLIDEVDQSMFQAVLDHIYFEKNSGWKLNDIIRIFKTADILKINTLLRISEERLKDDYSKVSSLDAAEILNSTWGKTQYDNLNLFYLCKHISAKWPKIDDVSQFCSISWSMMENMLKSPEFCPNDVNKILDICSTWIAHDAKNRYRFLRKITQILNPKCVIDDDKNGVVAVADMNDCSQQVVRDKLWEILSRIPYNIIPSEKLPDITKRLEEIPMFVSLYKKKTIYILNADLNKIASFPIPVSENSDDSSPYQDIASTTMINDNLFILLESSLSLKFLLYKFSLKKCFLMSFSFPKYEYRDGYWNKAVYTLLNYNNELYCCSPESEVMKFSMQLDRWMIISNDKFKAKRLLFTSDDEKLYRMYETSFKFITSGHGSIYVTESYDFEKNVWSPVSSLPLTEPLFGCPTQLTVVNGELVLSTGYRLVLSDCKSKTWRYFNIADEDSSVHLSLAFAQCENEMLRVVNDKLFNFSTSKGKWQLMKGVPLKYRSEWFHLNFRAIHRPTVSSNQSL